MCGLQPYVLALETLDSPPIVESNLLSDCLGAECCLRSDIDLEPSTSPNPWTSFRDGTPYKRAILKSRQEDGVRGLVEDQNLPRRLSRSCSARPRELYMAKLSS